MIVLNGSTESLVIHLTGTVTTNPLQFLASFAEIGAADLTALTDVNCSRGTISDSTPVDLVGAPSGSNERDVKYISVFNNDTVTQTVHIKVDNGTLYHAWQGDLAAKGSVTYSDGFWTVYDSDGAPISKSSTISHAASHQLAGSDQLNVAGLSGVLADDQNPVQATTTLKGGSELATQGEVDAGTDVSRIVTPNTLASTSLTFDPNAHNTSHENGSGDEISVAGLSGLLADDQNPVDATETVVGGAEIATQGEVDAGTDDTRIVTPLKLASTSLTFTPSSHNASHILGGSDEVDGDQLDIDFTPSNYTPDITPAEATDVDHLSAHLAGIDNALAVSAFDLCSESTEANGLAVGWDAVDDPDYMLIDDCNTAGPRKVPGDEIISHVAPGGRLAISNSVGEVSDGSAQATLYYKPYTHNTIMLQTATGRRRVCNISTGAYTPSIAGSSLTASRVYDIFAYWSVANTRVELGAVIWTNDTTRATSLAADRTLMLVQTGDATRRYVGTIYTNASQQFNDQVEGRHVWNMYNRLRRRLFKSEHSAATSWTYGTATYRAANGDANNRVAVTVGLIGSLVDLFLSIGVNHSGTTDVQYTPGFGLNASTANNATTRQRYRKDLGSGDFLINEVTARYQSAVLVGRNLLYWVETASTTVTLTGTNPPSEISGITGYVEG